MGYGLWVTSFSLVIQSYKLQSAGLEPVTILSFLFLYLSLILGYAQGCDTVKVSDTRDDASSTAAQYIIHLIRGMVEAIQKSS